MLGQRGKLCWKERPSTTLSRGPAVCGAILIKRAAACEGNARKVQGKD
jgi:hypothetical protein